MSIKSKIQALITAANTKTGESDTTLTDAVQTLVDGYGQGGGGAAFDPLDYVTGTSLFPSATHYPTSKISINFLYATSVGSTFQQSQVFDEVILSSEKNMTSINFCFFNSYCKKIDISNLKFGTNVSWSNTFQNCSRLTDLKGVNLAGASNVLSCFVGCSALQNLTFKPNTCAISVNLSGSSRLTDESLVSVANGLVSGSYTLTLHATPKARCSQITGTVSSVTDGTGTYDFFTADANGAVTLTDFITNTKGWTLA